jgi:hypothetical protein
MVKESVPGAVATGSLGARTSLSALTAKREQILTLSHAGQ